MLSFGVYVFYINGPAIYPTSLLKNFNLKSNRFSIISEMNVKALRSGVTYIEVPGHMKRGAERSTALSFTNFLEVMLNYLTLVLDSYYKSREIFKLPNSCRVQIL